MLAMGRALMGRPRLLMLDEPSLGLAPLIVREIFSIIADLRATGVSILLVEQNARAALQVSDYGYVLETGELALEGPSAELAGQSARRGDLSRPGRGGAGAGVGGAGPQTAAGLPDCEGRAERRQWALCPLVAVPIPGARPRNARDRSPAIPIAGCFALAEARRLLLEPARLDGHRSSSRVLASIHTHEVDFADLYFQYSRIESWSLEEGIVKSGSLQHRPRRRRPRRARREAGVRVLRRHHAAGARGGGGGRARDRPPGPVGGRAARRVRQRRARSMLPQDPVGLAAATRPRSRCSSGSSGWRARAIRASTQVMASLAGEYEAVLIARSDGCVAADVRPLVRVSLTVIVEEDGRREQGYAGGGGRFDYGYFTDAMLDDYATQAVDQALLNLDARAAPAGTMTVVLGHGWPGILLHEAIGHGLEGDFNRKGTSAFSGRVGQRVAAPGITVVDDGTHRPPARLAQRRRRGQSDAAHGADRGRHPAGATCRTG